MRYALLTVPILALLAVPAFAASSFLGGFSGGILTPDDVTTPVREIDLSFHDMLEILGNDDLTTFGVTAGILENFEIGASMVDAGDDDVTLSGKYRLITESATSPAILVGVFDVMGTADGVNGDASFYLIASKNMTAVATEVADRPSRPLRLTAGFGSGIYDGFLASFDWTLAERLSLMAEYTNAGIGGDDSLVNAGFRWAATNDLRLDAALIDFDTFAFGLSYRARL